MSPCPARCLARSKVATLSLLCAAALAAPLAAQQADLAFPLLLERERLEGGNPLAPYAAMLEREDHYLASPTFRSVYPEIRALFEEFMGVPWAGIRALSLPSLRREFQPESDVPPDGFVAHEAVDAIARRAATTRIVVWGEEHHLPQTRSLYEALLRRLWAEGYRYLAAEAFTAAVAAPDFRDVDYSAGLYVMDPVFASAVRTAISLGYRLVPYDTPERGPEGEQGFRDRRQAENIYQAVFERDPNARVLVLAGRGHASETTASDGWQPMAAVLKQLTGVNPLTIYAPTMSMRLKPEEEHPLYRALTRAGLVPEPVVMTDSTGVVLGSDSFDAYVFWPRVRIESGREDWIFRLPGRQKVEIPFALPQDSTLILVQAFERGRTDSFVPDDQVLVRGDLPSLALPPGEFRVRAILSDGRVIAEEQVLVEARGEQRIGRE